MQHLVEEVELGGGLPHGGGEGEGLADVQVGSRAGGALAVHAGEDARLSLLCVPTVPVGCVG